MNTINFQLAKAWEGETPPRNFSFEIKYDGERTQFIIDGQGKVSAILSRRGTEKKLTYPELANAQFNYGNTVLDCEICVFNDNHISDFDLLATRSHLKDTHKIQKRMKDNPAIAVVLDVPIFNGQNIMSQPYENRRKVLEGIQFSLPVGFIIAEKWDGFEYEDAWAIVEKRGEEGLIGKSNISPYSQGSRNNDWIKIKAWKEVFATVKLYEENPAGIRLTVIDEEQGEEHGVQCADKDAVRAIADAIANEQDIRIAVQYLSRTQSGKLRFPSFRGIDSIAMQDYQQIQEAKQEAVRWF